jgi:hypothetical protein
MANSVTGDVLTPNFLVIPKLTAAEIATVKLTAEIGAIFYDTTNNKLNFVKNGGAIEAVTSA